MDFLTRPPQARRTDNSVMWISACLTAVLFVAGIIVLLILPGTPKEPGPFACYPELESADPALCARIRAVLDESDFSPYRSDKLEPLLRSLTAKREAGTTALLRVLLERYGTRSWCQSSTRYTADREAQPLGTWLADLGEEAPDALLLRLVADREIAFEFRVTAVIGLCRKGHVEAVSPLAAIVKNRSEDADLRKGILRRLPRIGEPLAEHVGDLVYIPFYGLDECAAAALTSVGEPLAPSLIRDGLRQVAVAHMVFARRACSLAQAALLIAIDDEVVRTHAAEILRVIGPARWTGPSIPSQAHKREAITNLTTAFASWVDRHPECLETDFERRRAAYFASDRRKRELAVPSIAEIAAAREDDFDLAAVALVHGRHAEESLPVMLERLDRLTGLARRRIEGLEKPERIIDELNRLILPPPIRTVSWHWEDSLPSDLNTVLRQGVGNCLGLSLLYLAVAERLDLPIRCVRAPQHVFLRWDDGATRRNIEATAGGIEHPDEWYVKREGRLRIQPGDVESGLFLTPLTRREILAVLLSNLSHSWSSALRIRDENRQEVAIDLADQAILLNPRLAEAYLNRAAARLERDPGATEDALADIEAAVAIEPTSIPARLAAGRFHGNAEQYEEAIRWFDSALELAPDDAGIVADRLKCLLRLGRLAETVTDADAFLAEHQDDLAVHAMLMRARVRLRDDAWRGDMADVIRDHGGRITIHLVVAELLLQPEDDASPDPAAALEILDEIRDRVESAETSPQLAVNGGRLVFGKPTVSKDHKQRYHDIRKTAREILALDGD
jgi:regulator of sirC expression with transglutaminase-like and TPR domain